MGYWFLYMCCPSITPDWLTFRVIVGHGSGDLRDPVTSRPYLRKQKQRTVPVAGTQVSIPHDRFGWDPIVLLCGNSHRMWHRILPTVFHTYAPPFFPGASGC